MQLRRFNASGIERFREYIATLKIDKSLLAPSEILTDDTLTEAITPATECPDAVFANRLAAAEYLDRVLTPAGLADAFKDVGLWSWLTLRFFDQLCPRAADGTRDPGAEERLIPLVDVQRRYYRHLLLGPSVVFQAQREDPESIAGLLADPVTVGTAEVFRTFIENPTFIRSHSAVGIATRLYYDPTRRVIRRGAGAGGKTKRAGTCRRLISVLRQFDCTYDLYALGEDKLFEMLPKEFDRFKQASALLFKRGQI